MGERATPFELEGPDGAIPCILREAADDTGLAVVLPGFLDDNGRLGGSPGRLPLGAAVAVAQSAGLSVLEVWWERPRADAAWLGAVAAAALDRAGAIRPVDAIVAKSMGTWALAHVPISPDVATVWLTPLVREAGVAEAIAARAEKAIVVAGSADPMFDLDMVERLGEAGVELVLLHEADHRLEVGDPVESAQLLAGWLVRLQTFLLTALSARRLPAASP
jgi:hypothetical protein